MDELILRRAQKGDASAFEQLVTPYEQMIWRVCWHYLHHREDAMAENGFEPADDSPTPEAALLDRESTGDISRALDQLPADMRTVLILYALEKQRYEDIAQITGVSVGTVKSRLNRARQKLAAILANQREQNEKSSVLPSERRTGK